MSIIDTLITDRTAADTAALEALFAKAKAGTITDEEWAVLTDPTHKGAYNYTDLNRVSTALEYLRDRLNGYGYATPGYKRIEVPHRTVAVSKLPEGFTELSYIQSSGTQYIDTEFIPTPKTKVEADIDFLSGNTSFNCVFGVGQTSANQFVIYRNGSNMVGQVYSTKTYTTSGVTNTGRNNCVLSNSEFAYGAYSAAVTSEDFAYTYPLYLFALNSVGNATLLAHMKLYSNKIYDNDTLIRDYVPVKDENGNVGLYDLVEGKFYGNAGTGAFIAGPIPVELPVGYTQVEYIQSSGTQYVDTGFKPNQDSKVIVDVQFPATPTAFAALFGVRNANTNQFWSYYRYSADAYSGRFGTTADKTIAFDPTKRATVTLDSNVFTVNGTSISANSATFESEYELYLFMVNNAGTTQYPGSFKLYSCQIYDNGTLVRDYVPCKNPDGAYVLYDVANSKFYSNAGSGAFTGGAVVDPPVPSVPSDDETRDSFLWYEDDIPTANQMAQYITNVAVIRDTMEVLSTTPAVPGDMEGLTAEEANAIEFILIDVQTLINNMVAAWFYSGDLYAGEV